ncbi:DNA polymerase III subunit delta' [Amaricoccus sp.]|uniref:DNA polymerase III subunit delta' n=1 Tax=Amaricoccus sp. TaxID=1872485 RepID=UPI001B6F976E|nr:DNA polymerase III subunit delta' [Amaricoccus sp.]MBP7002600.1 DNA polymerase III subunit delta' [Amaricoccus sp.]
MSGPEDEPDRLEGAPHPRLTERLYGQEAAERAFLAAEAAGRLHHGWLVTGPRGVGKATLAWRIARRLRAGGGASLDASLDMDPAHPVFRRVAALGEPGIALVRRGWDDKAKRFKTAIGVDEVRALKGFFQLTAADGAWRVAIVDAADELTPQAANALLKTLEEPPARALLLLVCHAPARLLPTIRSRCRELRCAPLGPDDLARALAAAEGGAPGAAAHGDPDRAAALATLGGGSVGEAMRLAAVEGPALYDAIAGLLAEAPGMDRRRAVALAESCAGRAAETRYDAALALIRLALARAARAAAGAPTPPVSAAEARALARHAADPAQARIWAELGARLGPRIEHARAVHLDPGQVILDTLLRIDAAAAEARALAG